jgi:uncharacterized protein with HEPN domain
MRRERLYLEDILSAADAIAEFLGGQDFESFEANRMLRSAVVHQLTIIGEAVAHLSVELRERHSNIPWTDIKGFRNIIVHNYFGIDWEEIWLSAKLRVPVLREQVSDVLCAEFPEQDQAT